MPSDRSWSDATKWLMGIVGSVIVAAAIALMPRLLGDSGDSGDPQPTADAWLVIESVESFGGPQEVRVLAFVNGTEFVYPSIGGVEWLEVGPSMSAGKFKLPRSTEYEVRFEMNDAGGNSYISQERAIVRARDLPFQGEYNVHKVSDGSRVAPVSAAIRFKVTRQP